MAVADSLASQLPSGNDVDAAAQEAGMWLPCSLFETVLPHETKLSGYSCQFLTSTGLPCRHMLQLFTLRQENLAQELLHGRWRCLDPAQLLVLKEALLTRRPPRLGGGEAAALTRDDRFALALAVARGMADVAASSDAFLRQCLDGLAKLKVSLQRPAPRSAAAPAGGADPGAGGLALTPDGAGGGGGGGGAAAGEQCHACWGFGHRRTTLRPAPSLASRRCPCPALAAATGSMRNAPPHPRRIEAAAAASPTAASTRPPATTAPSRRAALLQRVPSLVARALPGGGRHGARRRGERVVVPCVRAEHIAPAVFVGNPLVQPAEQAGEGRASPEADEAQLGGGAWGAA